MPKPPAVDPDQLEQQALTLRTVGWILVIFAAMITSLWIFVGFRSGSYLWFYWTVIQGIVGAGLVVAGMRREELAASAAAKEAQPHTEAGERGQKAA